MRLERLIETWGTVIIVDASASRLNTAQLNTAIDEVAQFFYEVNEKLSTYIESSEVSRVRSGALSIADASSMVQEVWQLCEYARELTLGAYDPWAVDGGFDPSGLVKGWAAEIAAQILVDAGCENVLINAAGDLYLRGGQPTEDGAIKPWEIGINDPTDSSAIVKLFHIVDGAVATSGTYFRGAHITDPHTGLIAIGARSASVIGPSGAITDALATALMVDGRDAQKWIGRPELADYTYWVANRDDETAWSFGPAINS
jgi:thiamine biosynthesis lipoprotein